jgi:DNA invertase Pin-like site-specific DNA recombinase
LPNANRLTVGIMAMVAEDEGLTISARTKAAITATKARGTKLGGNRGVKPTVNSASSLRSRRRSAPNRRSATHLFQIQTARAKNAGGSMLARWNGTIAAFGMSENATAFAANAAVIDLHAFIQVYPIHPS